MQVEQSFEVQYPAEMVWRSFHDTEGIVTCLPGASLTELPLDGNLKLAMTVKLGPIVAAFAGDARMELDDASRSGSVVGGGSDRKSGSRVKGEARFSLHEVQNQQPATKVQVVVDFTITGNLAQFSRGGIVQELAARLTDAFAENLRKKLESESSQAVAVAHSEAADSPAAAAAANTETVPGLASSAADGGQAGVEPSAAGEGDAAGTSPESASAASPATSHSASDSPAASPAANPAPIQTPRPAANAAPLDLGSLFWPMLLGRIKRLFGFVK